MLPSDSSAQQATSLAVVLLIVYCLYVYMRNIVFHPLKNYPGPFLAKLTDGYTGFHALLMHLHLVTYQDLGTYGPVVRHGPNKLVFSSVEALREIYLSEKVTKSSVYLNSLQSSGTENVWSTVDREAHRHRKRTINPILRPSFVRMFEPVMVQETDVFLRVLLETCQTHEKQAINMTNCLQYLTLDIVGHLALGRAERTQTRAKHRFLAKGLIVANYHNNVLMQCPVLAKSLVVLLLHCFTARKQQKNMTTLQLALDKRRRQGVHAKHDLLSAVSGQREKNNGQEVKVEELASEVAMLYVAGGETSATTMSALFFYLARNRDAYNKLADEIRSTFASGAEIRDGPQLINCTYLRACIDEALRLCPPVPGTTWREQSSGESGGTVPFVVDGHVIPPGTRVGVCTYALHHNETYFPEPFAFKPERWVAHENITQARNAFAPFSIGTRACAGKALAYLEMSLTVSKTLWYFDFELPSGQLGHVGGGAPGKRGGRGRQDEYQLYDIFASAHDGPVLTFRTRGDFWRELR